MATYEECKAKLKGVSVPLELLIPELERLSIYPPDIEDGKSDNKFYYKSGGKYVPVRPHQLEFFDDGRGVIGYWLKEGLDFAKAEAKVNLLLVNGMAVQLYTKVHIMHNKNRETEMYIFTTVAKFKELP